MTVLGTLPSRKGKPALVALSQLVRLRPSACGGTISVRQRIIHT